VKVIEPNGYKFELHFFDCFRMADGIALFEVKREEEFAPVKNATGNDSPESARCLMS
jgi:UDP-N-acetylglucosamine pyrophosphorylase